ncbi:MerR family transcriptional regulator [Amycolatopsis pithecellobii]|uniref:MerR family transcriptional regulator n=1 Tax=Amycolatopsis pithecellobii TaxID=664692 RepID=A0A6N7ZBE2_9PSEU|nr:MerR family transcriptional regulator [Amycolatopsis pithecellobii]MTD59053.1 MerR family transcriptional regulator [Amycolatopsis pithecellobii]
MRIGELAAKAGVSVRALRYYEEQGLLHSMRSPSGQRQYPDAAVDRVTLIQQLYAAGLSSKTILGILPCVSSGEVTQELLDLLVSERDRISGRIEDLTAARDRLEGIITASSDSVTEGKPCSPDNRLSGRDRQAAGLPAPA